MSRNLIQRGVLSGVCFMVTLTGFVTVAVLWFVCLILNSVIWLALPGYDWKSGMHKTNAASFGSLAKFWEQRP